MNSFKELNLSPSLMRAIEELGYEKPSPIQVEALPILLGDATDFIGLAATGTGKTAAFAIPLLEKIDPKKGGVQGLILCPTRELAIQVAGQIDILGKHLGVKALPIYGGAGYGDQLKGLRRGTAVVVGTPGRVIDHLEKGTLQLGDVTTLILDEADEMISMGFKEEIEAVLSKVDRDQANIWLFSATMSREVRYVADEYLTEPAQVQINRKEMLPDTIEQLYYRCHEGDKPEVLCKLMDAAPDFYGLIFCQTKALVVDLVQYLRARGYLVDCLHGDMEQDARERTMRGFRDRKVNVLVCTDVASRGLDVKDITHVINYSIPRELDNYVHRIGRTARSGKKGVAMSLVTPSHRVLISRIENMTKSRMTEGRIPTRREIGARKVEGALSKFSEQTFHTRVMEILSDEWKAALSTMTVEEVAARFLTMLNPEVFADRAETETKQSSAPRMPGNGTGSIVKSGGRFGSNSSGIARIPSGMSPVKPLATPMEMPAIDPSYAPTITPVAAVVAAPVAKAPKATKAKAAVVAEIEAIEVATAAPDMDMGVAEEEVAAPSVPKGEDDVERSMKSIETAVAKKGMLTLDALAPEALVDTSINEAALKEKKRLKKLKAKAKKAEAMAAGLVDGVAAAPASEEAAPAAVAMDAPVLRSKTTKPFIKRAAKSEADVGGTERPSFGGPKPLAKPKRFSDSREGGFKPREGGFKSASSYGKPRGEGGFKPREGGFGRAPRGEGGFKPREGGFAKPRGEGFGTGPGAPRTWSRPKSKGWVGGRSAAEGSGADVGLGRAPQDRNDGWSKPKAPWTSAGASKRPFAGGSKPFGKKKEGGFDKPRWNKDKA